MRKIHANRDADCSDSGRVTCLRTPDLLCRVQASV